MSLITRVKQNGWNFLEVPTPEDLTQVEKNITTLQTRLAIRNLTSPISIQSSGSPNFLDVVFGKLLSDINSAFYVVSDPYTTGTVSTVSYGQDCIGWTRIVDPDAADGTYSKQSPCIGKGYLVCVTPSVESSQNKIAWSSGLISDFWNNSDPAVGTAVAQSAFYSAIYDSFYVSFGNGQVWIDEFAITPGTWSSITVPTAWDTANKYVTNGGWAESATHIIGVSPGTTLLRTTNETTFEEITSPLSTANLITYNKHWKQFVLAAIGEGGLYISSNNGTSWSLVSTSWYEGLQISDIVSFGDLLIAIDGTPGNSPVGRIVYSKNMGLNWFNLPAWNDTDYIPVKLKVVDDKLAVLYDTTTTNVQYIQTSNKIGGNGLIY